MLIPVNSRFMPELARLPNYVVEGQEFAYNLLKMPEAVKLNY
jgi:hypothetical protein